MAEPFVRVDFHVHTRFSHDSLNPPEGIVASMDAGGIDRVAITDHNEIDGALLVQSLAPGRVIVGEEVKTREGADVIGLLLTERIPKGTPARETCEMIRAQGGVVYLPHPFDTRRSGGAALLEEIGELIDVVEAHNARTWNAALNGRGERWARDNGKPLGAGSDAHSLGEIGRGYVEMPPFEPERESLLAAFRAGTVVGRLYSSPAVSLISTYAKVHKLFVRRR